MAERRSIKTMPRLDPPVPHACPNGKRGLLTILVGELRVKRDGVWTHTRYAMCERCGHTVTVPDNPDLTR